MPRRTSKKDVTENKNTTTSTESTEKDTSSADDVQKELEAMKAEMQKQMEELKAEKEAIQKEKEEVEKEKESIESVGKGSKPARVKKELPKIDRNEMILCRNLVEGSLSYTSQKTGLTTRWSAYGDEEYIEFGELMTMKSSQPRFLNEPWIAIGDDDVISYLGLNHIYDNIIPVDELDDFFKKDPVEISKTLDKVPNGTKSLVATKARKMVGNEELYDNRVIKVLEKKLEIDLSMVRD